MPKGVDSSRWPQRDLTRRLREEGRDQQKTFGVVLGPQDSGERSIADQRGAPVGGVFEGAPADAIRLAQMHTNKEHAWSALMQPPPAGGGASKMVDLGMGRLSTGKSYPIHSYRDERIMLRPDTSDRAGQFHDSHTSAHGNTPHPNQD